MSNELSMTEPIQPATVTRIEKIAVDNGFDLVLPQRGQWLGFASTQAPLHLWLTALGPGQLIAALSQPGVARALADRGTPPALALPPGAAGAISVADIPTLHRLVRRAFQLSKTLPDELLHTFQEKTATLPRTTEAERLVVRRVGQDVFRQGLLDYWDGRCAITGLAVPELLRASHIKPWAECETDAERLSVFNGLLLAPHLDAAFDCGLITVTDGGGIVASSQLVDTDRRLLGLDLPLQVQSLEHGHQPFLRFHREHVFRDAAAP
jgi:putative restriction endonuclease